jgi:hypothetical protein
VASLECHDCDWFRTSDYSYVLEQEAEAHEHSNIGHEVGAIHP